MLSTYYQTLSAHVLLDAGRAALFLTDDAPPAVLRYAFIEKGIETPLFPAFILDDWGNTLKGRKMYRWFREYGDQFPRAEVFGRSPSGAETQRFLRELEIYARPHCFAFSADDAPLAAGIPVDAVLLPDANCHQPTRIRRPEDADALLRLARLKWWRAPATVPDPFRWSQLAH